MTLLAVAPRKFSRGVEAPGARLRGKYRTPSCALGTPATYDWRSPPGSAANTAHVLDVHELVQHDDLLGATYDTDAHFVAYVLSFGSTPLARQPRVNKGGLAWVESLGYSVSLETLVADVDNPNHAAWSSSAAAVAAAARVHSTLRTAAVYATTHGLRIVQPLTQAVPVLLAEASIRVWLATLEELLAPLGLAPDWACDDWPRVFRAPNVVRDGKPYRSPAVLRTCDPIPPPAGHARPRVSSARRRTPIPGAVSIARVLDPGLVPVALALSRAFAGGWRGERHTIGLALAGALLWARVPREQVPALVASIAEASGWDVEHHRGGAVDTVQRWSDGYAVSGRSALPDSILEAFDFALGRRRAVADAAPAVASSADREEETRRLTETIRSAPIGLTVIKAQCGFGKTHAARSVAVGRALRSGEHKENTRSAIAVPRADLAEQVTRDLRAAGAVVTRLFGPLSLVNNGRAECQYQATAAALAAGGQSVRRLYCGTCDRASTCAAKDGQDAAEGARVFVGPHELLADLIEAVRPPVGTKGAALVFVDEAPTTLEDLVFPLDDLVTAERTLPASFERSYVDALAPVLRAVRQWTEVAPPEETGSIARAFALAGIAPDPLVAELPEVPPLDRHAAAAARGSLLLATKLGRTSQILRSLWRACVRPGVRLTAYDRGGRSLAVTAIDLDIENAIISAKKTGEHIARRVVIASADAHLRLDEYRALVPDLAFHDFAAPDGAPIHRVHLVINGSRARLATDDPEPIRATSRLVAEWALEAPTLASCGVVTFKRHEQTVLEALEASAPSVRWEVAHYGAVRGLDRWKDFDGVATIGDPRPNLDAVSRELGGGGAEVESRYERADAHARSELEQAHGRLRVIHRRRPGRALHVGALLPLGWPENVEYRRPPEGRMRRPVTPGLAELVEAAGGQRAAARAVGRSLSTVQRWASGEGRPDAADVEALRRAGTERRLSEDVSGDPVRPVEDQRQIPGQLTLNNPTVNE